jgi:1-pyrroline-5-carboxylate dehydrogenase
MQILSETSVVSERDFKNAENAVTCEPFYDRIMSYIGYARTSHSSEIIAGGKGNTSTGDFVEPTAIVISDPHSPTM